MLESDIHWPWWAIDSSHTGGDLHVVLVALGQTGDVQRPHSMTVHWILWDVGDLVISKVIAAQLENSDWISAHEEPLWGRQTTLSHNTITEPNIDHYSSVM